MMLIKPKQQIVISHCPLKIRRLSMKHTHTPPLAIKIRHPEKVPTAHKRIYHPQRVSVNNHSSQDNQPNLLLPNPIRPKPN